MTELLKPVVSKFIFSGDYPYKIHTPMIHEDVKPAEPERKPPYPESLMPRFEASPTPETRIKSRAKRRAKKKKRH